MKVPLSVSTYFDNSVGGQKLKIWSNCMMHIQKAPINPYMYSTKRPVFPCILNEVERKLLSKPYKTVNLYKCGFNSSGDVGRYGDDETCLENHVNFVNRLYIDESEWVTNFANTNELKIMSFDCEMESDGRTFPIPSRDAIAGIGYKCVIGIDNVGENDIDSDDIVTMWSKKRGNDSELIMRFLQKVDEFDPDIIVGFNSNNFDLRYINDRCKINGINFAKYISRGYKIGACSEKDAIMFIDKTNLASSRKYTEIRIDGRISYDLHYPVIRDQSMFGIKNRKMKTVAKWYKISDVVEEDMSNVISYLDNPEGMKKLDKYLRSDINITDALFGIYVKNTLMLAEKLMMPLDDVVNSSPSLISNVIFGRELSIKNIVSDGTVIERYNPEHVSGKRGGWVETYKSGFIEKLEKLDFKSYYPFLVVQFNISPETTFIVGYEDYQGEMGYRFWWKEENGIKWFYASIPDSTFGKNVVVKIDMTNHGFLPIYMKSLFSERALLKKRMKEIEKDIGKNESSDNVEYAGLKSRENAVKIIINSFTGYVGSRHSPYGNLANYVCITGFGRYFTQRVIHNYESIVVSSDTDAIYTDKMVGEELVNRFVSNITIGELGFEDCVIVMENEGNFGSAFFLDTKGKNYYILDLDRDIIVKHGVATKSTKMAKIVDIGSDKILKTLLTKGLSNNNVELIDVIDSMYDINKWDIESIKQGTHVKNPKDYQKGSPLGLKIALLAQKRWDIPDRDLSGMQVNYIKLKGKSNYTVVDDLDKLSNFSWDEDYYINMLDKLLDNLNLSEFKPGSRHLLKTEQKTIMSAWE